MALYTVARDYEHEIVIEKSKFICTLKKVASEEEAQDFIKMMKKKYWNATHNCSAYIIGTKGLAERSNDDGEPSGTAGLPMLEVLRKNELHNVVAVVTRYFGGIKLGAGGLVRAYTNSVVEALNEAGIAEKILMGTFSFKWDLNDVGRVLNKLYSQNLFEVTDVEYSNRAKIYLTFKDCAKLNIESWLTENLQKSIELEKEFENYLEKPKEKAGEKNEV
jgi:uncharacterized YigZ family protein